MACKHGKLKSPVREGKNIRRCKLKPKTKLGRARDRKTKSKEFHEVRHRKQKRNIAKKCRGKKGKALSNCKKRNR